MGRVFCGVLMFGLAVTAVARTAGAQTATITGTITTSSGQPLPPPAGSSSSRAYAVIGSIVPGGGVQQVASAEANTAGAYTLTGVTPGTYRLFTVNSSQYVNKTWDGFACIGNCGARDVSGTVTLTAGQTLVVNFALDPSAVITGRVLDSLTRAPVANVSMTLSEVRQGSVASTSTNADGVYSFPSGFSSAVAGSSYHVVASSPVSGPYVGQAYPGLTCNPNCRLNDVAPIRVATAQTVSGIDFHTPQQGAIVSGQNYVNFGWALTPQPKLIPFDGSTISVVIDGVRVGTLNGYNFARSDVTALFPGLKNSAGPVGYRVIDTTALNEGLHTIAWVVTDDAGQATGIGSRYFTVQNSAWVPSLRMASRVEPAEVRHRRAVPGVCEFGWTRWLLCLRQPRALERRALDCVGHPRQRGERHGRRQPVLHRRESLVVRPR